VRMIDPAHRHVEQALSMGIDARVGHAKDIEEPEGSFDVVLVMGPLYHLLEAGDRLQALHEARRVLRPGGLLVATAISRFAALLDQLIHLDRLQDPDELDRIETIVSTGTLVARPGGPFTSAFLHLPRQLLAEVSDAGFEHVDILGVEGPGFVVTNFEQRWSHPTRREALMVAARLTEHEPEILAATSHLLAVARAPHTPSRDAEGAGLV
jgi:SAM-dependent methyltransferase